MNDDLKVRRAVAQEHGLDGDAAKLLVGETVEELDASAARLAALVHERDAQHEQAEQLRAPTGIFELARAQKAERRERLMGALTGRAQPRDARTGKFAAAALTIRPAGRRVRRRRTSRCHQRPQTHESWLADAIASRAHDVGANL